MIIVKFTGGLGNQMFQYALGRNLAIKNHATLKLDTSFLDNFRSTKFAERSFQLSIFNILENRATLAEIRQFTVPYYKNKYRYKVESFFKKDCNVIIEKGFEFKDDILNIGDNHYLTGNWQSEQYFCENANSIRADFTFKSALSGDNAIMASRINETNSVSVHFRRTDYITNKECFQTHGICDLDYYKSAVNYISEKVENPVLFIFSDDIEYVKKEFKPNLPTYYIDFNKTEHSSFEDMRLMSLCKANIIANSSFSWWAAWLNNNPNKLVISPLRWFNNSNINSKDLIPKGWIKL